RLPHGYEGEAWRLFEDLVGDGFEFVFGRRVIRLGAKRRGEKVSDLQSLAPPEIVLVLDAKAAGAGFDASWDSLRPLIEYVKRQQSRQRGQPSVGGAVVVSSTFRQEPNSLRRVSAEFLGECGIPLSFLEAATLSADVMLLREQPHLRNAIYEHLIAADEALDEALGKTGAWVEAVADDFNCDGRSEVHLAGDKLSALLSPSRGGWLYELDVRSIRHNLLATLARRPEAYHQKVLAGANQSGGEAASIHDRVVFKQDDLDQRVQYDPHLRKSLIDHFWDDDVTLEAVARCEAEERGDFVEGQYEAKLRRNPDRIQVQMTRSGRAFGLPLTITKGVTLEAGSSTLEVAYLIEGVPQDRPLHFAVELNFAGLPSGADDRFFYGPQRQRLGQLGEKLDMADTAAIGLVDEWLGIDLALTMSRPSHVWTFPIETVSQSEGGFELVHQSVVVQPHWFIQGDADGRWSVSMKLAIDTSLAESRRPAPAVAVTS
ncbi:MAG: DUF1926 domain-containing protein, partial [Planctomycetes bacterium]|nr:DUF1926 domain-containing protein [Planctomycetota bacterium]